MAYEMELDASNYSLAMPKSAAPYVAQAGGGGGAAAGAVAGGIAGSVVPIVGNIIGAAAGAVIGGLFDAWQGSENRKQAAKFQAEAKEMAERQFAWGQKLDRFGMDITSRQQNEAEKYQRHKITQEQVDRLNQVLRTNQDVQNHVRTLWGGK